MSQHDEKLFGEMGALIQAIKDKRDKIDNVNMTLKSMNQELKDLETKALNLLESLGIKSYPSPFGTISTRELWRVNVPQGQDRDKFFKYLKDQGLEHMMTVNSNTLNSFFQKEWTAAIESGKALDFKIPGLGEPTRYVSLSFRK